MKGSLAHTTGGEIPCVSSAAIKEYLFNSLLTIESLTPAFHGIILHIFFSCTYSLAVKKHMSLRYFGASSRT